MPTAPPPFLAEIAAQCTAVRLRLCARAMTRLFDEHLRDQPLRISQLNLLVAIAHRGPCSPGEVCRWLALEKSTLSRDLDRLVAQGWLERRPAGGRRHELAITPAGLAVIEAALPAWRAAQEQATAWLGYDGLAAVDQLAHQLVSSAKG